MPRTLPAGSRKWANTSCDAGSTGVTMAPPCGFDGGDNLIDVGHHDHDVDHQPRLGRRRAIGHPGATHATNRVIESGGAVTALPDVPPEHRRIKFRRDAN